MQIVNKRIEYACDGLESIKDEGSLRISEAFVRAGATYLMIKNNN